MTREEALQIIYDHCQHCDKTEEALVILKENKGEWISEYDEDGKTGWYECSCCHSERAFNTNFCPDCGADMRGE